MAPAALAAAAAGRRFDAGALDRDENGLIGSYVDCILGCSLTNGASEYLIGTVGWITRLRGDILCNTEHFAAHKAARQAELFHLRHNKAIHCLRAAEEYGVLPFRRVFADQFRGDEAMLEAFGLFIREDVNDLDLRADRSDFVELIGKEDGPSRPAAEKDRERKILNPVADGARHGEKRRDTAAASQSQNVLRVAKLVIVEMSLRRGCGRRQSRRDWRGR